MGHSFAYLWGPGISPTTTGKAIQASSLQATDRTMTESYSLRCFEESRKALQRCCQRCTWGADVSEGDGDADARCGGGGDDDEEADGEGGSDSDGHHDHHDHNLERKHGSGVAGDGQGDGHDDDDMTPVTMRMLNVNTDGDITSIGIMVGVVVICCSQVRLSDCSLGRAWRGSCWPNLR